MRIGKVLIMLVFLIFVFGTVVNAEAPEITATSATVIDCLDGKILYSKNADEKLYPASITQILTAILVVENCGIQEEVTVSQKAINDVQSGYLTANIKAGEVLTVEQLLNLLMISSYSDVANVLAEHVAGSTDAFVEMMNSKATQIGCTNSNFVNCHGEHNANHYSTAHDIALIGKYAAQYDAIINAADQTTYVLGITNKYDKGERTYYTANAMLMSSSNNYYRYAKGLKTGFTTPAGYCIITYSEKNDIPLVSVVMKSTTSDSRYEDAKKILDYAYQNNTIKTIAKLGTNVQTINIKGATSDTKKLNVILENTVTAVVNVANEDKNVEPKISLYENLRAPIKKGQVIGTVSYEIEGKTYSVNLIAESEVEKSYAVVVFIIIFICIIILIGFLRVQSIRRRTKVLKKIRGK